MRRTPWLLLGLIAVLLSALLLSPAWAATPGAQPAGRSDAYQIQLVIDGKSVGRLASVSGIGSSTDVIDLQTTQGRKYGPGATHWGNITISREAIGADPSLYEWYKKVLAGTTERKSGSIIYLDREGNEVLRYNFFEAWPCRWKAPELNASSDTHIVEEIEFVVEKVERA
ncbi:MAG TPA: phage tail protein [Symbiobacteriaceae bacterium]|nr:phage tail protein [Symbiobacteriaceae bacterium]